MKTYIVYLLLLVSWLSASSQTALTPTDQFVIEGAVQAAVTIGMAEILAQPSVKLKPVEIVNHLGDSNGKITGLRGVRLQPLLAKATLDEANSKFWSEFYYVFEASDGYKVVYSWNEIFNTAVGGEVYLLTERGGHSLPQLDGQLVILTPTDLITGRRYLKCLARVRVMRVK
jgi:hypothetical protein